MLASVRSIGTGGCSSMLLVSMTWVLTAFQASDDRLNYTFRFMRVLYLNRRDAGFLDRIIVPTGKQGIADEDHFTHFNAKDVSEFSNTIGFVDSRHRHVNGGRAAQTYVEFGNALIKKNLYLLPLGEFRIPFFLLFDREPADQARRT